MRFEILDQGFVIQQSPVARGTDLAISPRVVVHPDEGKPGQVVCSFMHTAKTATNDFVPLLTRSTDFGHTWSTPCHVWPHLRNQWSLFVGISRDRYSGRLFIFGTRTAIDLPGESLWSDATQGLKANEL